MTKQQENIMLPWNMRSPIQTDFGIRDGLPEKRMKCVLSPDRHQGIHIDSLLEINDGCYYIRGWAWDALSPIIRISIFSPEGNQFELLPRMATCPRIDVDKYFKLKNDKPTNDKGFMCFFQLPHSKCLSRGWLVEMENTAGTILELKMIELERNPKLVIQVLTDDIMKQDQYDKSYMLKHAIPALCHLNNRMMRNLSISNDTMYGTNLSSPDVTMIVPLKTNIDLMEHQLNQFARDHDMKSVDLIYVLPDQIDRVQSQKMASQLHLLYRQPFRLIHLNQTISSLSAQRVVTNVAKGRLLVFCNSEVIPARPGWLSIMVNKYQNTHRIGALGPKLLYEDNSLNHAGLFLNRSEQNRNWRINHYFKGLHRLFPDANHSRLVQAVTGSCIMMSRSLFVDSDAYNDCFLGPLYSSVDLCLRFQKLKHINWFDPSPELYYLEELSFARSRHKWQILYDDYVFFDLWNEYLESIQVELYKQKQESEAVP